MSTTSFDGPIKAGDILNTIGTTLSDDVANVGFATMAQVYSVSQASADPRWTDIVIPANSQITRIAVLVTTAGTYQVYAGRSDSVGDAYDWFGTTTASLAAAGWYEVNPNRTDEPDTWKNTGAIDCHMTFFWTTDAGAGRGMLVVEYIQNNNLT